MRTPVPQRNTAAICARPEGRITRGFLSPRTFASVVTVAAIAVREHTTDRVAALAVRLCSPSSTPLWRFLWHLAIGVSRHLTAILDAPRRSPVNTVRDRYIGSALPRSLLDLPPERVDVVCPSHRIAQILHAFGVRYATAPSPPELLSKLLLLYTTRRIRLRANRSRRG